MAEEKQTEVKSSRWKTAFNVLGTVAGIAGAGGALVASGPIGIAAFSVFSAYGAWKIYKDIAGPGSSGFKKAGAIVAAILAVPAGVAFGYGAARTVYNIGEKTSQVVKKIRGNKKHLQPDTGKDDEIPLNEKLQQEKLRKAEEQRMVPQQESQSKHAAPAVVKDTFTKGDLENYKKYTTYDEANKKFQEQQAAGKLKPFTTLGEPVVEKDGTKTITYVNPELSNEERVKPENQVKYKFDKDGKLSITAGTNVSCVIPPIPKKDGEGFEVTKISKGGKIEKNISQGTGKSVAVKIDKNRGMAEEIYKGSNKVRSNPAIVRNNQPSNSQSQSRF